MNTSTFWMIKYMNGSVFSKARYINGVGFEILARTSVLTLSYTPSPYTPHPPRAKFTLGPDAALNPVIQKKKKWFAPTSVNASKRKHKNQINHYNKQRRVLMTNSIVCQSKWKPIVESRRAKPKTYRQAPTHWLKFYEEAVVESEARKAVVQLNITLLVIC